MNKKTKTYSAVAILIIIVLFTLAMFKFTKQTGEMFNNDLYEGLNDTALQYNAGFKNKLNSEQNILKFAADSIALIGDDKQMVIDQLKSATVNSRFTSVLVSDTKGRALLDTGEFVDVNAFEYFTSVRKGRSYISGILYSSQNAQRCVVMSIPMLLDDVVVGVIAGRYDLDEVENIFLSDVANNQLYGLVMDSSGEMLFETQSDEMMLNTTNVFDFFDTIPKKSLELNQIKNAVSSDKTTTFSYEQNGRTLYATLLPTGVRDWYTISIAKDTEYLKDIKDINKIVLTLVTKLVITMLAIGGLLIVLMAIANTKITDANKKYTYLINNIQSGIVNSTLVPNQYGEEVFAPSYVSLSWEKMTGYNLEELKEFYKNNFKGYIHPDDLSTVLTAYYTNISSQSSWSFSYRLIARDGSIIWVDDKAVVVFYDNARSVQSMLTDITATKTAKDDLANANEQYLDLISDINGGVFITIIDVNRATSTPVLVSEGVVRLFGYTEDEIKNDFHNDIMQLILPEDREDMFKSYLWQINKCGSYELNYRIIKKDGNIIWVLDRGTGRYIGNTTIKNQAIVMDVTDSKEKEVQLEGANKRYTTLISNLQGGLAIHQTNKQDQSVTLTYASEQWTELTGYNVQELEGKEGNLYVYEEDLKANKHKFESQLAISGSYVLEYRIKCKNGERKWVMDKGAIVYEDDDVIRVQSIIIDVTEKKEQEQQLEINNDRFKIVLAQTESCMFEYDFINGQYRMFFNTVKVFGYTDKEALRKMQRGGKRLIEADVNLIFHPNDVQEVLQCYYKLLLEGKASVEARIRRADDSYIWCSVQFTLVKNAKDQPARLIGFISTIEDEKLKDGIILNFVYSSCDYFICLDLTNNSYVMYSSSENGTPLPARDSEDYYGEMQNYIDVYVADEDKEFAREQMQVENIAQILEVEGEYVFYMGVIEQNRGYTRKQLKFVHYDADKNLALLTQIDVTNVYEEEKKRNKLLQSAISRAEVDQLTMVYNKESANLLMRQILHDFPDETHAFMILDIDNFKSINDGLGHMFGDSVLIDTAAILKRLFRTGDVIGRFGGDEFMVLMKGVWDVNIVSRKAKDICDAMRKTYRLESRSFKISCSLGVAMTEGKILFEQLYSNADTALYNAKAKGKDGFWLYTGYEPTVTELAVKKADDITQRGDVAIKERIFDILYSELSLQKAIDVVLALVGEHFDVSRVYVFEAIDKGEFYKCSNEWRKSEQLSIKKEYGTIPYEGLNYQELFDKTGLFYSTDFEAMEPTKRNLFLDLGVKAIMQVKIMDHGEQIGFIGCDDCNNARALSNADIDTLLYCAKILAPLLQKRYLERKLELIIDSKQPN